MTANWVNEWKRSGSVPEFLVIYRYLSSKNLVTRSEQQRTWTYKKMNNYDFKTMSERTSVYTSECQISPKFSRTLAYAGPIIEEIYNIINLCKYNDINCTNFLT